MSQHPGRLKQMQRRRAQGLTHKELGEEFGMSRVHAGRLLGKLNKDNEEFDDIQCKE